jgi:hypothetical protein
LAQALRGGALSHRVEPAAEVCESVEVVLLPFHEAIHDGRRYRQWCWHRRDDISHASATRAPYDERLYQAGPIMRLHRSIEVR